MSKAVYQEHVTGTFLRHDKYHFSSIGMDSPQQGKHQFCSKAENGPGNPHAPTGGGYQDDPSDSDEDAGPIEITKQASQDGGELAAAAAAATTGGDEDEARNGAAAVPGGGQADADANNATANKGNGVATGMSSSELRAQQGKEDRPVFDMFSAAALPATAGGPAGKMGGKGGGAHGMSFLGEDGGGDQVIRLMRSIHGHNLAVTTVVLCHDIYIFFYALMRSVGKSGDRFRLRAWSLLSAEAVVLRLVFFGGSVGYYNSIQATLVN